MCCTYLKLLLKFFQSWWFVNLSASSTWLGWCWTSESYQMKVTVASGYSVPSNLKWSQSIRTRIWLHRWLLIGLYCSANSGDLTLEVQLYSKWRVSYWIHSASFLIVGSFKEPSSWPLKSWAETLASFHALSYHWPCLLFPNVMGYTSNWDKLFLLSFSWHLSCILSHQWEKYLTSFPHYA